MSTAATVPEKRQFLGEDHLLGLPPEKRAKIDDLDVDDSAGGSDPEEHSSPRVIPDLCMICKANVGHTCWECPNRSKGMGWSCSVCLGPCKKKNDPDYEPVEHDCVEVVKQCVICWTSADHFADECPYRSDGEEEDDHSYTYEDCLF